MTENLSSIPLSDLLDEAKRRGLDSRILAGKQAAVANFEDDLFPRQREFFSDKSRRKAACCGRRSGKTSVVARILLDEVRLHKRTADDSPIVGYIAPTKRMAKRLMWGRLKLLSKKYNCGLRFNETELIATAPGGAEIWILGADKQNDIEKLRGFSYTMIVIDEAQAVGAHFEGFIDSIIEPALSDYNGSCVLTGTPNAGCIGFFHAACTDSELGWSTHHWTVKDNSEFPQWRGKKDYQVHAQAFLDGVRKAKNWPIDHPTYRREWMGEWVYDAKGLVYGNFTAENNLYDGKLPEGKIWRYVAGVDLGFDDKFAIEVLAWNDFSPIVYEVYSFSESEMIPSEWAEKIAEITEEYSPEKIICDTGGLGKAVVEEFRRRFAMSLKPATKKDKYDFIIHMNGAIANSEVKIIEGGSLHREWMLLQWDADKGKEHRGQDNHCSDAFLYAWREARGYLHHPEKAVPATQAQIDEQQMKDFFKAERVEFDKKRKLEHKIIRRDLINRLKGTKCPWHVR